MIEREIRVVFEPRDSGVGFARAQISTPNLDWTVSERHFEEIHGLSRVVLLIPDKLVTTFAVIQDLHLQRSDKDGLFCIDLVLELCQKYIDIAATRPVEQLLLPDTDGHVDYVFSRGAGVAAAGSEQSLGFSSTLLVVRGALQTLRSLANPDSETDFFAAADRLVKFCDEIREACLVYLDFAHPVLIRSRRGEMFNVGEETVEQRFDRVGALLERRNATIENDYEKMRHDQRL